MRTSRGLAGAIGTLLLLGSLNAQAQFNAPIRYNEGPGVKLSDSLVFHPGIALEGRYDSNVFYSEDGIEGAPYLRVLGHLDLATLPPQRLTDGDGKKSDPTVAFRLSTAVGYREYLHDSDSVKQQRALEVDAGLDLTLFPAGMFSFTIADKFARTVTARNSIVRSTFARDTNRATARLKLAPGGGRLAFALSYSLNLDLFEDSDLAFANRLFHEIALNAKWRLLPKTAVMLDVTQQIYSYYDRTGGVAGSIGYTNNDSYPLRIYAGFGGLFTPSLSFLVKAGYGNGFYDNDDSYNMLLALAELGYRFSPVAKLRLGFDHNFQDSIFGNYFTDEKIYVNYDHMIAARFLIHVAADYRYRNYDGFPDGLTDSGGAPIDDLKSHLVSVGLGFDWQILEWMYVGIGYDLQLNSVITGPKDINSFFANDYTKHQVFGKVGVSY